MKVLRAAFESGCLLGVLCFAVTVALFTWPYWLWKARKEEREERRRGGYWDHP